MNKNVLNTSFTLPCGATLKNRLVKSAMTERISNKKFEPVKGHIQLYQKWLILTPGYSSPEMS
jgi:2,4-dienoyl-CoA reductase-like NADH-dependent reductase (Old Yellow Enzyme family)